MRALTTAALVALPLLLLSAGPAAAESPRSMMMELHLGSYTPEVDSEFSDATPWKDIFGTESLLMFKLHVDYQLWQGHGTLAIGGSTGYGWVDGVALNSEGQASNDKVGFNVAPFNLGFIYRWDWASRHSPLPLVPYFKVGLTAAVWWATNAKDEVANTRGANGQSLVGRGVTLGWHAGVGLQFLLDILAPGMASEFDYESGVNNSYVFAELLYQRLDDFGSDTSMVLSDTALSFGLMFEF
ncbi:MAG: hypothetical protein CSA66_02955 [Proteobacteria bacterium]|nr:MAG: hypothetical protein CSA66_02955 [Pseudomonadota bacterium]